MIRIFIGYDEREAQAYHACVQSIIEHTTGPVAITPLALSHLQFYRETKVGSNAFVHSRFLVPALCDFTGWALYMDSDMMFRVDPYELFALRDLNLACHVVKHDYRTRNPRKYIGTEMESPNLDYPQKNWSSLILWNCGQMANRILSFDNVERMESKYLHRFQWLSDVQIGGLPAEWNHLVLEQDPRPDAKVVHWTCGVPTLAGGHYAASPFAEEWRRTIEHAGRCG